MKDEGLTTNPELSKAEAAVSYLLRRVQVDADLRWHMLGTEAFYRLCEAEAERTGISVEGIKENFSTPLNYDKPRLIEARKAVADAIEVCYEHGVQNTPWGKKMLAELEGYAG